MTTLLPGETLAASLAEKVSETWQKINTSAFTDFTLLCHPYLENSN